MWSKEGWQMEFTDAELNELKTLAKELELSINDLDDIEVLCQCSPCCTSHQQSY